MAFTPAPLILAALSVAALAMPAAAADSPSPQAKADEAAAAAIAAEMKANAGQQGAVRTAARHFAEQLESHHTPASPGDGAAPGAKVAQAIDGSLPRYQKAVPDYRMDEKVSLKGNVVTITSYTTGTYAAGGRFEDVSLVAYEVQGGKIVRAHGIHTNPGAIQKAMAGSDERARLDNADAERIAAEMRASAGKGIEIVPRYLAEKVAVTPPAAPERNGIFSRDVLAGAMTREVGMVKAALTDYANTETVRVQGNKIMLDGKMTGVTKAGEQTWSDTDLVLSVTDGKIVGIATTHSAEGSANLRKVLAAAGQAH